MEKYSWTYEQIEKEPYWELFELEFGDWQEKIPKEKVIMYADELPF